MKTLTLAQRNAFLEFELLRNGDVDGYRRALYDLDDSHGGATVDSHNPGGIAAGKPWTNHRTSKITTAQFIDSQQEIH